MRPNLPSIVTSIPSHPAERDFSMSAEPFRADVAEPVFSLSHYFWLLRKAWWKIALTTFGLTALIAIVCFRMTPAYESTARIAIDLKLPSSVIGDRGVNTADGGEADQYFNTQLQLMQSDPVLRPVAEHFNLMTNDSRRLPFGMKASDAAVTINKLTVLHPANSFLINVTYRSPDPMRAAAVANAVASSFILRSREMRAHSSMEESAFMEKQIGELKKNMDDSEMALAAYEKQLGVINSDEKTSILSARLQQLNTEYTAAQADRMQKEVELRALKSGDQAAVEVSPQATALARMEENLQSAQEKMDAAKTVYGTANPEYKRAAASLAEVTRQYNAMRDQIGKRIETQFSEANHREQLIHTSMLEAKSQSDALNAHSAQYQELKREAESNKTLYAELYRKVKEAGINGAFEGSAIRIADPARPEMSPVFPNKVAAIGLGFLFSLGLSSVAVLFADFADKTLRDPSQARREVGLDVIGILPQVRDFKELSPIASASTRPGLVKPNRWFGSVDFYQEAIGALLSTIRLTRFGHPLRSVLITSATKGEGKSSCVAHLAASHARQGFRTLLIDADLRCPTQHRYFGLTETLGLTDAVTNNKTLHDLRRNVKGNEKLDLITAGLGGSQVTERIGHTVEELLKEARKEYDIVFIDAPPMLCFAEPIHLACLADGVLVVCQAGETSKHEVSGLLATLQRLGATPLGLVLNQVQQKMSQHYKPYQAYYRGLERTGSAA